MITLKCLFLAKKTMVNLVVALLLTIIKSTVYADVSIDINFNGAKSYHSVDNIPWSPGMKVWDAMVYARDINLMTFTSDSSKIGRYITSIDGVDQVAGSGPWWLFCVKGITSRIGIDDKLLQNGDAVEWYYKNNFPPCPTESKSGPGQHPEHAQ